MYVFGRGITGECNYPLKDSCKTWNENQIHKALCQIKETNKTKTAQLINKIYEFTSQSENIEIKKSKK